MQGTLVAVVPSLPRLRGLAAPVEDRLGIHGASGYVGVTIMRPDRPPYAEGGPADDEALAQFGGYDSRFGRFAVDEAAGIVTWRAMPSERSPDRAPDGARGRSAATRASGLRQARGSAGPCAVA